MTKFGKIGRDAYSCKGESEEELSDSSTDTSVVIVSDSDDSEDELDSPTSVDDHDTAAAVAAAFLNTSSKTGGNGNQIESKLTEVGELCNVTSVTSIAPPTGECVSCIGQQTDRLEPLPPTVQPIISTTDAGQELKLTYCLATDLRNGLGSAACSDELNDCLDPVELLSLDKCGTLNIDVCGSSFLDDLSFINDCLIEDDGSSQLLPYSDIQKVADDKQSNCLNECTSESTQCSYDISSCLLPASLPYLAPVVDYEACLSACSQTVGDSAIVDVAAVKCEPTSKPDINIDTLTSASHGNVMLVSASCSVSDSQLWSEKCNAVDSRYQDSLLNSMDQHRSVKIDQHISLHACLDLNANELLSGDVDDKKPLVLGRSDVGAETESHETSCDMSVTEDAEYWPLSGAHKRLHPEDFSEMSSCKRSRVANDCLSIKWLAADNDSVHQNSTNNSDAAIVSAGVDLKAHSGSGDDCFHVSDRDGGENVGCCCCELLHDVLSVSYCTGGHACCVVCLQQQVKRLLSSQNKESFRCLAAGCQQFYNMSRLCSALPQMVIDILEEKMEKEYRNGAKSLLQHSIEVLNRNDDVTRDVVTSTFMKDCRSSAAKMETREQLDASDLSSSSDTEDDETTIVQHRHISLDNLNCLLPHRWSSPTHCQDYSLVNVNCDSVEYNDIAELFYHTMTQLDAFIVHIQRLQNPVLWQFYAVQKKQWLTERASSDVTAERILFHGIKWRHFDSVARSNIDWRTTGFSHGVMFGQGTCFARDASYAHEYTDVKMMKRCDYNSSTAASEELTTGNSFDAVETKTLLPTVSPGKNSLSTSDTATSVAADVSSQQLTNSSAFDAVKTVSPADDKSSGKNMGKLRAMVAARVFIGQYTAGHWSYRKPPPLDPTQPFSTTFDSCVNYVDDPTLFVVFESNQCYPEYFVTYCVRSE